MAMFIRVDIDESVQADEALKKQLVEVCPVDIFAIEPSGAVGTVEANLDECTLCRLCLDAAGDKVTVMRLYSGQAL